LSIGYITQAVDITFPSKKREKKIKKKCSSEGFLKRKNLFLGKVHGKKPK
jgi:hypothetical protein